MIVDYYKEAFTLEVGTPDVESDLPVPWFARNYRDKVQWSAYIGPCQGPGGLAFGINDEFLAAINLDEEDYKLSVEDPSLDDWTDTSACE